MSTHLQQKTGITWLVDITEIRFQLECGALKERSDMEAVICDFREVSVREWDMYYARGFSLILLS